PGEGLAHPVADDLAAILDAMMLLGERQVRGMLDDRLRLLDAHRRTDRHGPGEAGPGRGEMLQAIDVSHGVAGTDVGEDDALGARIAVHRVLPRGLRRDVEDLVGCDGDAAAVGLDGHRLEDLDRRLARGVGDVDPGAAARRARVVRGALQLEGPGPGALVADGEGLAADRPAEARLLGRRRRDGQRGETGPRNPDNDPHWKHHDPRLYRPKSPRAAR